MRRPAIAASGIPGISEAAARLRVAIAGSALLHVLCAWAMFPVGLQPNAVSRPATIAVRIERLAPAQPAEAAASTPPPSGMPGAAASKPPRKAATAPDSALPPRADPTVYSARELDSLPSPVLPLDIGRLLERGAAAMDLRLELIIDEHGAVSEVALAAPAPEGIPERELRAALAATPFVPARKDGRAVRSRIMLSVSLAASKAGE